MYRTRDDKTGGVCRAVSEIFRYEFQTAFNNLFTSWQVSVAVEEGHFQSLLHNAASYVRKCKAVKLSVRLGSVSDRNAGIKARI